MAGRVAAPAVAVSSCRWWPSPARADALALAAAGVTSAGRDFSGAVRAGRAGRAVRRRAAPAADLPARVSDQISRILAAVALPLLLLLPILPVPGVARLALLSAGLVIAFRMAACTLLRYAHRGRGRLTESALVLGAGTFGAYLAGQLRQHPELGLRVRRSFLDSGAARRDLPEPCLGRPRTSARSSPRWASAG